MPYLVVHDVDAIQGYVFATDRLQEVQGASALIDRLNRRETRRRAGDDALVYANGGGAAAQFASADEAYRFCREIADLYPAETVTASSTGVVQEYGNGGVRDFQDALQNAHRRLRQKKAGRLRETQFLTSPFFKRCQSCGVYPAVDFVPQEPSGFVCASCRRKRRERQEGEPRIHEAIREIAGRDLQVDHLGFPTLLDQIGRRSRPEGYIGVIYADGNRMGDLLTGIQTPKALGQFSQIADDAVSNAITGALLEQYRDSLASPGAASPFIPATVPLCGGDDLVAIVPGQHALELALAYLEKFQQHSREALSQEGCRALLQMVQKDQFSACAGVAIARAHTPLSRLLDLAHSLCRQAKQRSYWELQASQEEVCCVDFQVITTPNWEELNLVRTSTEYQLDRTTRLTARPYTVQEAGSLLKAAQALKDARFPSGKLHDLYRKLRLGPVQAKLEYLTLYVRAREGGGNRQKSALRSAEGHLKVSALEAPWQSWPEIRGGQGRQTPYGDLVEIYGFISAKE